MMTDTANIVIERMQTVVDVVFGGNINAAARAMHVLALNRTLSTGKNGPRGDTLQKISDNIGIPVEYFYGEIDLIPPGGRQFPGWYWLLETYHTYQQQLSRVICRKNGCRPPQFMDVAGVMNYLLKKDYPVEQAEVMMAEQQRAIRFLFEAETHLYQMLASTFTLDIV